ncbi:MAG: hypothetical protein AMXMBFR37_05980 [Steroidobacteraceae bacterium]
MILKASQRGGGRQLAVHLMRADENEHVEVHEIRGFMADDLRGAFQEIHAASKGTRAKQPLFSLSLNPPPKERVPIAVFESAIERIEQRLGLTGQPRTVVFHEKDGRRHAHAVWSRIDIDQMKAINLSHYKLKLRDLSRELFMEHGWRMPPGLVNSKERDPFNCTLDQWQQMQRAGQDRKAIQQMFRECWAVSDSGKAFTQALKARGYTLARGDRRGVVAVDYRGEVYAVAKYAGIRTKQVNERIGALSALPSVDEVKEQNAARMSAMLKLHIEQAERANKLQSATLRFQYAQIKQQQQDERAKLRTMQEARWNTENAARAGRISRGFRGIWDRLTGKYAEIKHQNEREALLGFYRDRAEKDELIFRQLEERERLQQRIRDEKKTQALGVERLHADIAAFGERKAAMTPGALREKFQKATREPFQRGARRERDFEPEL